VFYQGGFGTALTMDSDHAWTQRFTGHLESAKPSITRV